MKKIRGLFNKHFVSRLLLIAVGIIIGLLIIEGGLRLMESFSGSLDRDLSGRNMLAADDELGMRVVANAPGHDGAGFRNEEVPADADIVCIGDSQTWGNNAAGNHAWPQILGRLSGSSTYNMGMGGYGPVEYGFLIDEAIRLSSEIIVIGLYFGNDIWDACNTAYMTIRRIDIRSTDPDPSLFTDTTARQIRELGANREEQQTRLQRSVLYKWAMSLREYSAAVRQLTDSMQNLLAPAFDQGKAWAEANPEDASFYESEKTRVILTTSARLLGLDLEEPRIREGLRITKQVLLEIKSDTALSGTRLLVLLIPTAESVYEDAVIETQGGLSSTYSKLVDMENTVRNEITSFCVNNNIEYADALPALKEAVKRDETIYPESGDGHPVAKGYYYFASAAMEKLEELGWLR